MSRIIVFSSFRFKFFDGAGGQIQTDAGFSPTAYKTVALDHYATPAY